VRNGERHGAAQRHAQRRALAAAERSTLARTKHAADNNSTVIVQRLSQHLCARIYIAFRWNPRGHISNGNHKLYGTVNSAPCKDIIYILKNKGLILCALFVNFGLEFYFFPYFINLKNLKTALMKSLAGLLSA
jgi:hypothetical protein